MHVSLSCERTGQDLSDVLLYASHPDHQLKGLTALAVGSVIQAILVEGRGDFNHWFRLHSAPENGAFSLLACLFVLLNVFLYGIPAVGYCRCGN